MEAEGRTLRTFPGRIIADVRVQCATCQSNLFLDSAPLGYLSGAVTKITKHLKGLGWRYNTGQRWRCPECVSKEQPRQKQRRG